MKRLVLILAIALSMFVVALEQSKEEHRPISTIAEFGASDCLYRQPCTITNLFDGGTANGGTGGGSNRPMIMLSITVSA